ncbi:undecaprenyldiphospho-muramoylpentapeptide beta-N-acetylglucosaminyltransferase [Magnetospira sp. QH-2]|uniref:undecaprenyldiphospho-muramoylpentapeptide beta-N-acetylglucosaminyltransferase n=1 Tax=Magnetospira sp. (strain QH-2) TaxID=1288970 RepID=UPI0003E8102E|nr:undecaprenyldiphospho-muramoylpentapeptide beta-N-acetylglucosaminyltransferase [Magnetospira sp. QH-2]CCQ72804.1 GT28 : UDP-N-acetylglucosamine:N-acetylmuramyl-(pentapeptide) pyrophosphoryl-undecaprenol N-acetylglucosamine transferase [Magnetospira sp. QH-2]
MTAESPLIVLAAGGTGGHVFPAEALAEELIGRGRRLALITDRRGNAYGGRLGELETHRIRAGGLAGRGLLGKVRGAIELGIGVLQARALLNRLKPSVVVGFGGYAAVPTMLAAGYGNLHSVIHEQNAILGRANRLLSTRVDRIATSFTQQEGLPAKATAEIVHTGLPVRPAVLAQREVSYSVPENNDPLRLLVLGGSQGARIFSDVLPQAMAALNDQLKQRIEIVQQCRPEDLDRTRQAYESAGVTARLESFFEDVPQQLADCHLLIARAGASTIAEMTCVGRPAILVPYPHAIDDHQTRNAHAVDAVGGGWMIPQPSFTPEAIAARLTSLADMPEALRQAANCSHAVGRPAAAAALADLVEQVMNSNGNGGSRPIGRMAA